MKRKRWYYIRGPVPGQIFIPRLLEEYERAYTSRQMQFLFFKKLKMRFPFSRIYREEYIIIPIQSPIKKQFELEFK